MTAMLGAIIIAVVVIVVIPVGVIMSSVLAAVAIGWSLKDDADARFEGSELLELNG
jgi:hypothetical protein